jgi:hypothetical protein
MQQGSTSWTSPADGDWNTASNWSNGVPSADCRAVINLAGSYTVTIVGGANARGLDLGGLSGTQTLQIAGSRDIGGRIDSGLTISASSTIGTNGALAMTQSGNDPGQTKLEGSGSIVNNGSFVMEPGSGAGTSRFMNLAFTNAATGSVQVKRDAEMQGTTTNGGAWTVSSGATLVFEGAGQGPTVTQSAGTFTNSGTTRLDIGTFTHSGGNMTGAPVRLCGHLNANGPGTAAFDFQQVPGGCGGGQIESDIGANDTVRLLKMDDVTGAEAVSSGSFTNRGTLEMGGSGTNQQDILSGAGTLTNEGTLTATQPRDLQIQKNVDNKGTMSIASNTAGQDTSLSITGTFTQTSGTATVSFGSHLGVANAFTVAGGQLVNSGTVEGDFHLVASGGQVTGNAPLFHHNYSFSGTGSGTFNLVGGNLNSDVPSGYHLIVDDTLGIEGTGPSGAVNHGTIEVRGGLGHNPDLFDRPLDNQGTLTSTPSAATSRAVSAVLTNEGTISPGADLAVTHPLTNSGTISVTGGSTLSTPSLTQSAGTTTVTASTDKLETGGGTVAIDGGTLAGAGTVHAAVTNGGTVDPAGVLTVDGA